MSGIYVLIGFIAIVFLIIISNIQGGSAVQGLRD